MKCSVCGRAARPSELSNLSGLYSHASVRNVCCMCRNRFDRLMSSTEEDAIARINENGGTLRWGSTTTRR